MYSAPYSYSENSDRPSLRRRAGGLLLAIVLHALLILLLLTLAPKPVPPPKPQDDLATFSLLPEKAAERSKERAKSSSAPKTPNPVTPSRTTVKPPKLPTPPLPFIEMSSEDLAAADIAKMPSRTDERASGSGADGAGTGRNSGLAQGPGEGPGGVQLFDADWYRKPTDAELATYMPANAPPNGWGMVACKTVENFRVENCQQLGESPLGSGYARAVRLASWQFMVRPPRVDGRSLVGSWVRIRIDYTQRAASP